MDATSPVSVAPGELEFVRAFVNTRDVETGTDRLTDDASWHEWAATRGVDGSTSPADLAFARALRESLRVGMLANHDRAPMPAQTAEALTDAAARGRVSLQFGADGARFVSTSTGIDGVLARVASATALALSDGTWSRLKACVNDSCQWGFYDNSRSRTGQWCSMEICGNRAKQARWRASAERDS